MERMPSWWGQGSASPLGGCLFSLQVICLMDKTFGKLIQILSFFTQVFVSLECDCVPEEKTNRKTATAPQIFLDIIWKDRFHWTSLVLQMSKIWMLNFTVCIFSCGKWQPVCCHLKIASLTYIEQIIKIKINTKRSTWTGLLTMWMGVK